MDRTTTAFRVLLVGLAAVIAGTSHAAPVPKADWWLEVEDPRNQRHFVRVATGERRRVRFPEPRPRDEPTSPDGRWVASVKTRRTPAIPPSSIEETACDLVVAPAGKPDDWTLIGETAWYGTYVWSADSKTIVFLAKDADGWAACSAAPDGSGYRRLTQTHGYAEKSLSLRVLRDGRVVHIGNRKRIQFKTSPTGTLTYTSGDLVIADGFRDRIVCRQSLVGNYVLSPDETRIAYSVSEPLAESLVVQNLLNDRVDRVAVDGFRPGWEAECGEILWRPDGGAVAFSFGIGIRTFAKKFPDNKEPYRHIGITRFEQGQARTEVVAMDPWQKDEKGKGAIGYSLLRWVSAEVVDREGGR